MQGAQAYFLLGGANDFFGYMVHEDETFQQTFEGGALWLAGCPENAIVEPTGLDKERACKDHWALMVSPTIGQHIVCTLQNAADTLGFATQGRGERCTALTALDGLLTPDDLPSTGAPGFAAAAWEQARAGRATTLGGCRLWPNGDRLLICREVGRLPAPVAARSGRASWAYFEILGPTCGDWWVGGNRLPHLALSYSAPVRQVLPAVYDVLGPLALPAVGWVRRGVDRGRFRAVWRPPVPLSGPGFSVA